MHFVLLTALLCLTRSAFASQPNSVCKRELQAIISASPACAEGYFGRIESELRKLSPLLFSSEADLVFENIANTYGVTISTAPTFGTQCNSYTYAVSQTISTIPPVLYFPFGNNNGPEGKIVSLQVSVNLVTTRTQYVVLGLQYFQGSNSPKSILLFNRNCGLSSGLKATFEDGGAVVTNSCSSLNSGITLAPVGGSIMTSLSTYGVSANTPIYLSVSNVASDFTSYTFNSATLQICSISEEAFAYDVAKSNLNVPGLRYDSGIYYYTTVLRDQFGQMQYVTISSNNINC